jgi:signal transduction histidine kinase
MYDFLPESPLTAARHRIIAPMPDAALFSLSDRGLLGYEVESTIPLSPSLSGRLRGESLHGDTFHVADSSGEPWRLRRCGLGQGPAMWRFQSLEHSRCRLAERLRMALAPRLAAQVLHELRNPMNAMSLHADLLVRTVAKAEDPVQRARAEASVQVIRARLADLNQRQDAMVALWLTLAQSGTMAPAGQTLSAVVENALQLLRGLYALHGVMLRTENLDRITAIADRPASQHFQLVLIALLTAACETAAAHAAKTSEVTMTILDGEAGEIIIELGPSVDGRELGLALGASAQDDTLAALCLLLESECIDLRESAPAGTVRLTLPKQASLKP